MAVGSIPPPGFRCNALSRATARLAGPFELVDPSSVKWSVKSSASVALEGDGDFLKNNFSWYQDFRAQSKKGGTITFTAKYSCFGSKTKQSVAGELKITCSPE
jgi:hypothetical protein